MRLAVVAALAALLLVPVLVAWALYRAIRIVAAGLLLLVFWAFG